LNNDAYWINRIDKLVESLLGTQERHTNTFLKAYKQSLTELQAYSSLLYSKYSKDGVLTLNQMYVANRYKSMEKQIASIIDTLAKEEKVFATGELKRIYKDSYVKTGAILTEGIPNLAIDFAIIPKGFIEKAITYPWSGDNFSSRLYKNKNVLIDNLRQTLTRGFVQGKSITEMSKDLKSTMDISATNSRRLLRTESMHCIASSHHDVYTKAGVEKVKFITANDSRVCDECDALNNKVFLLNESPIIPQHPNSRSLNIVYFED